MSQPAEPPPYSKSLPGEPPMVREPLTLGALVSIYHTQLGTSSAQIEELIDLKRNAPDFQLYPRFGVEEQVKAWDAAREHAYVNEWVWNEYNLGRYIASGLKQPRWLAKGLEIWDAEIEGMTDGKKLFPPERLAEMRKTEICKGANERMLMNRTYFNEGIDEDDRRMAEWMAKEAPRPLTPAEIAMHTSAMGAAARIIVEKRAGK